MTNDLVDPPTIGHNLASVADLAREEVEALVATAERWAKERPVIADDETAVKAADFLDQLGAWAKKLEALRKSEKEPHLIAAKRVDERWHPLQQAIQACLDILRPRHSDWLARLQAQLDAARRRREAEAAEAQRIAEEAARKAQDARSVRDIIHASEAERRAQEAAQAAAAVPERAQVRGSISGRVRSLRTTWHAHVVDINLAFRHYRERGEVRDLIERLANVDARAGVRSIPGCAVYSTQE